ncbi:hypothetical protein [Cupriavidus taiwanensis]|uniref:hypothetical protein n=1 Tax=Cupriavidus taiwanensis TaxID=164546 RepID=UPI000E10CA8E|nr:hypothetical protein [Cupriavidus taiwanensis]SOY56820.1 conserved hypothetical protein [Cupriavidus taiwanensis]SOY90725.1 conserved hypothetical protein [Cupriavidus taiwanensis]SOZ63527.1 conserved hypothetical protein [Cupriavidus taiwanensis]SOZ82547.1 conserved hypothetical protein [Cupriavidus taiwanensis]SOZ84412.1 conserved hypothetical protein [Cupriavidus taiwanensis]
MKVFRDTDAVLRWAYAIAQQPICKVSDAQRAMAGASATNKSADGDLSIQDQHGQAAMIRGHVESLPELLSAYGWAAYSWEDSERRTGNQVLSEHLATTTGVVNGQMRFLLMRRHIELGQARCMSCERIAEKVGVHKRTIQRYEPKINQAMGAVAGRFFDHLDPYFKRSGLIR